MEAKSDSFNFNSYNNHGSIGLINTPSARFYDESVFGITVLDGEPDNKLTMTANPFDWLEASFFYTDIPDREQCRTNLENEEFCQGYKDKGFNLKIRLKQEGKLPAIAIGINDIGGTGLYGSEYIVASYGIDKIDFSLGLGWGTLNGADNRLKNPFSYLDDSFNNRPDEKIGYVYDNKGGNFQAGRYFSGEDISPFFGISYVLADKVLLKAEYDSTVTPGEVGYKVREKDYSVGLEFNITDNLVVGISSERGSYTSLKFIYKNNPTVTKPKYKYKKSNEVFGQDKLTKLRKNIQNNGIGVNKIFETENAIGIELTQFTHPNLNIIEDGGWHFTNIMSPENMYEKFINFGHHDEFKLSGLTINNLRDKINNREMFYDHFADKSSTNKWKSNHKLKTVDLNNLPKYLLDNKEKYKDWFDLRD